MTNKEKIKAYFKWLYLNRWYAFIGVFIILFSILLVLQPNFIAGALDALRIPYAVGLTIVTVFFFIRGKKILSSCCAIALLILAPGVWPYFKPGQAPMANTKQELRKIEEVKSDFSVAHFNVKENNKRIGAVTRNALETNADFISFQEIKTITLDSIDLILKETYPYSISDLSIPGFGMAVYSKYPIKESEVIIQRDFPILYGVVNIKNRQVHFISATTSTPTSEKGYTNQIKQFKLIAEYSNSIDSALVVMGDMNAVPWSTQITEFLKSTDLLDSRKDLSGTFPAQSVFVKIPIDYIFHSPELFCPGFATTGNTSSNHLGIIGFYTFKKVKRPV
ncbi:MAG: endonuclease/exonuclease/phosphatase family protein [Bacteroidetes bacterium]|nr:endonuclease/exonuclease/phosphatase family protein [Bacteroidota bacterium]MBK8489112.1 endonuclease/exonuclease/phosphatase family protein [Bacteroidota bacterium]